MAYVPNLLEDSYLSLSDLRDTLYDKYFHGTLLENLYYQRVEVPTSHFLTKRREKHAT